MEIDWQTIFFFVGLFIIVGTLEEVHIIEYLGSKLSGAAGHNLTLTSLIIIWGSGIFSGIIDNIPFVTTMIPLIKVLNTHFGGAAGNTLWWSLSAGALSRRQFHDYRGIRECRRRRKSHRKKRVSHFLHGVCKIRYNLYLYIAGHIQRVHCHTLFTLINHTNQHCPPTENICLFIVKNPEHACIGIGCLLSSFR